MCVSRNEGNVIVVEHEHREERRHRRLLLRLHEVLESVDQVLRVALAHQLVDGRGQLRSRGIVDPVVRAAPTFVVPEVALLLLCWLALAVCRRGGSHLQRHVEVVKSVRDWATVVAGGFVEMA